MLIKTTRSKTVKGTQSVKEYLKSGWINMTASTADQLFRIMDDEAKQTIFEIMYHNSFDKFKDKFDDAKQEFYLMLLGWESESLITKFNRPDFLFFVSYYFKCHLSTNGVFYRKYSELKGKQGLTSVELDDPESFLDMQEPVEEDYFQTLSIMQFNKLIKVVLSSTEARSKFKQDDIEFYLENFIEPLCNGKHVTVKDIAKQKGLDYSLLLSRIKTIKKFTKQYLSAFL